MEKRQICVKYCNNNKKYAKSGYSKKENKCIDVFTKASKNIDKGPQG